MRLSTRLLAWFAVLAQGAFVVSWLVAGSLQRGYSAPDSGISALAADGASHPWIVVGGFLVLGLGIAALAPALRVVLPPRRATTVAVGLFVLAGVAIAIVGLARPECDLSQAACTRRFDAGDLSWQTSLHVWAGLLMRVALGLTPFALARSLWPSPAGALALVAGVIGLAVSAAALILYGTGGPDGLVERIELALTHLWVGIVAAGILYETRLAPKLSAAAALRPRDFFGSAWSGEGVALGFPAFLWRPIAPRFTVTRETTWHSDEVALVRDCATLANGRVEERLRFAHFVDPSHIHVSGDDMPEGADVTIGEDGYQIAPYRVLAPLGPARFILKSRDQAAIEPGGTLRYTARLSWHGLPVIRLEMRARPLDTAAPESGASAALRESAKAPGGHGRSPVA